MSIIEILDLFLKKEQYRANNPKIGWLGYNEAELDNTKNYLIFADLHLTNKPDILLDKFISSTVKLYPSYSVIFLGDLIDVKQDIHEVLYVHKDIEEIYFSKYCCHIAGNNDFKYCKMHTLYYTDKYGDVIKLQHGHQFEPIYKLSWLLNIFKKKNRPLRFFGKEDKRFIKKLPNNIIVGHKHFNYFDRNKKIYILGTPPNYLILKSGEVVVPNN